MHLLFFHQSQERELGRALLSVYTAHCAGGDGAGIDQILPPDRTRFFGYARQALAEAFRCIGIVAGDEVLIPGFLCAEVLSSLSAVGALPRFYEVDEMLHTGVTSFDRVATKGVRAVVVVNYFGFPQPLDSIRTWCRSHGAALIEDNAHGFLSAEEQAWLGRRGDFGVFSIRKTLALPNGAALVDNRPHAITCNGMPYRATRQANEWRYRSKAALKQMMSWGNLQSAKSIIAGIWVLKSLASGRRTSTWRSDEESSLPQEAFAPLTALLLRRCDLSAERRRRRLLYGVCSRLLIDDDRCRPVFPVLPEEVVPYGFPFYFDGDNVAAFQKQLFARGLLCFNWPDRLPETHRVVPAHYKQLMCISFLW